VPVELEVLPLAVDALDVPVDEPVEEVDPLEVEVEPEAAVVVVLEGADEGEVVDVLAPPAL
jgi:hypothetical protein